MLFLSTQKSIFRLKHFALDNIRISAHTGAIRCKMQVNRCSGGDVFEQYGTAWGLIFL